VDALQEMAMSKRHETVLTVGRQPNIQRYQILSFAGLGALLQLFYSLVRFQPATAIQSIPDTGEYS